MQLDEAMEEVGVYGFFPLGIFFLYNLIIPTVQPWIILSNQFVLREPQKFTCEEVMPTNFSAEDECIKCSLKENQTFLYEDENLEGTLVPKWDLVCGRKALIPLSTSMYFVGVFFSSFLTGPLVDKFGRKWFTLGCQWAMSFFGLILGFVPTFGVFTFVRACIGFFAFGCLMPCFIYSCEIVPASFRVITGSLTNFFWGFGTMVFPLMAYLCRSDPKLLLIIISLPGFLTIPLVFFTPESPVWALANGKRESVEDLIRSLAKKRGLDSGKFSRGFLMAEEEAMIEKKKNVVQSNFTWKEIVRSSMLLKHLLIMMYAWMINAMFFYGLSYSSTALAGSPYLNLFYSGLAETLSYASMIPILKYLGRRKPLMFFHLGAGFSLILVPIVRASMSAPGLIIFLNMAGKFCITFTFASAWLYSGELAPTSCRTTFFSICECASRLGSFAAPYTLLLAAISHEAVPEVLYGVTSLAAGISIIILPETNGYPLPSTKEDLKQMYQKLPPIVTENTLLKEKATNNEMEEYLAEEKL